MLLGDADKRSPSDKYWWIYAVDHDRLKIAFCPNSVIRLNRFDQIDPEHPVMLIELARKVPRPEISSVETNPKSFAVTSDLAWLQGRWIVNKLPDNGKLKDDPIGNHTAVNFRGEEMELEGKGLRPGRVKYGFKLDSNSNPKAMHIIPTDPNISKPAWALYEFEADKLRIAFGPGPERPKGFKPGPENPIQAYELVRDPAVTELSRLEGSWTARRIGVPGKGPTKLGGELAALTIQGEVIQEFWQDPARSTQATWFDTFRIVTDSKPHALAVMSPHSEKPRWWIYAVEGNKIKLAFSAIDPTRRPKDFDDGDPGRPLEVYELTEGSMPSVGWIGKPIPKTAASKVEAKPVAAEGELARLKGTWKVVAREENGEDTLNGDESVIIAGDAIIAMANVNNLSDTDVSTFTLDPSHEPKSIDLTRGDRPDAKPIHGIYRIDGFTLMICVNLKGDVRPTEFDTKAGTGHRLMVLRRKKPARPPVASPTAPVNPAR